MNADQPIEPADPRWVPPPKGPGRLELVLVSAPTVLAGLFALATIFVLVTVVHAVAFAALSLLLIVVVYPAGRRPIPLVVANFGFAVLAVGLAVVVLIASQPGTPPVGMPVATSRPGELASGDGYDLGLAFGQAVFDLYTYPNPDAVRAHLAQPVDDATIARCWPTPMPASAGHLTGTIDPAPPSGRPIRARMTYEVAELDAPPQGQIRGREVEIQILLTGTWKEYVIESVTPQLDPSCPIGMPPPR